MRKLEDILEESKFISYVDNVFVKIHLAITFNELETIDHFVNDSVYNKLKEKLDKLNQQNLIQMHDMINVKNSHIIDFEETNDKYIVKVNLTSRYVDYCIDKNSKETVSGNDIDRIEKTNYLTFEKNKDTIIQPEARKCPSCGSNMDVNNNGKCEFCGTIYNLEDYEWILTEMEVI